MGKRSYYAIHSTNYFKYYLINGKKRVLNGKSLQFLKEEAFT